MASTPVSAGGSSVFKDIPSASGLMNTQPERMGILSTTLAPSPVLRWILPARIRSQRNNDIVFVGSTFIQLHEFRDNGQLSNATATLDFGTQILGAKVISAHIRTVERLDAILGQNWDEEQFIVKGHPCTESQPPQLVVLITATSELIYVYARNNSNGIGAEFIFAKRALLEDVSLPERHLRHIAIDPECKILAVASYNTCTVFSLREVDDLKAHIDAWDPRIPQSFNPNQEQRMIQIDGHILKMDFLQPTAEDPRTAILLLVVANGDDTLLLLYKWHTQSPLDQIQPVSGIVQTLPREFRMPLLLIPSHRSASFAVVTETSVVFYDNINSSRAQRLNVPLPAESSDSNGQLWVQWAKPSRHIGYSNHKEDILLVREDGLLRLFTRPHRPPAVTTSNFSPGFVKMDVDTAVCMLRGPRTMGGDILIVGGSMSDGGVFHIPPRRELELLQVIPNISPIYSAATLSPSNIKQKETRSRCTFVTAGFPSAGNLNEIRFGHEAQIGWTVPVADSETINRIWALEHAASKRLFILGSHPEHTSGVSLNLENQVFVSMDSSQYPGLILDTVTLSAEMLDSDISLQITTHAVVAGFETLLPVTQAIEHCICADIDSSVGNFVIVCKASDDYQFKVGLIDHEDGKTTILLSQAHWSSNERPLCVALFTFATRQYIAAGYLDGRIEILAIDGEGNLSSKDILRPFDSETAPITSIVVIGNVAASHLLMFAGTRSGGLKAIKVELAMKKQSTSIYCTLERTLHIGSTAITVVSERFADKSRPWNALVVCGSRVCRISCFKNEATIDFQLADIWPCYRTDLTYVAPSLNAAYSIPNIRSTNDALPRRMLICATADGVLFSDLIDQQQMVPRRLDLADRSARLMVHSKTLSSFVVVSNQAKDGGPTDGSGDESRKYPTLHLVDPDQMNTKKEDTVKIVLGEKHEEVQVLLPWEPTDGKSHFDLIMVGLNGRKNSRLGFLSARKILPGGKGAAVFKMLIKFANKQLHAICAVDKSSLAISAGCEIVLMRLDVTMKKWHEDGRYGLPSPALSLSAQSTMIYAATEKHSTIVINWQGSAKGFEKVLTDRIARNARTVLPFGRHGDHLLVGTALGQGTSLLAYSIKRNAANASTPLFEAEMPVGIDHIMPIPTSWETHQQHAFQGIAFDGTIIVFQTLSYSEWKLLRFIEQLVYPDPAKPAKKSITMLTERLARNLMREAEEDKITYFNPRKMHVHGDVLKRLVDKGPSYLWTLLDSTIKSEDDMVVEGASDSMTTLKMLAEPIVGKTNDVPAAVIAWTRKMIRATIF